MTRREAALALLVCGAAAAAWMPATVTGHSVPFFHDLITHHHPWRAWAAAQWRAGTLPQWSADAGFPLLAAGEGGLLYPPTMALYALVGDARAMGWSLLLHACGTGVGLWAHLRATGLRQGPALLGGIAWTLSGWLAAHAVYPGMHGAVAWLPWGLLANRTLATVRGSGPLLALVLAMAGLAGHPQAAAFVGLVLLGHAIGTVEPGDRARWAAWAALGTLVAAPQLLATARLAAEGLRADGLDATAANEGALPAMELVRLVLPEAFGGETAASVPLHEHRGAAYWGLGASAWEDGVYVGVAVAALAWVGLRYAGRRARIWGACALAGVLVALGGPLWDGVRALPGMGGFRVPARAMLLPCLAACVLAAHGAQALGNPRSAARARRGLLVAVAAFLTLASGGRALVHVAGPALEVRLTERYARAPGGPGTDASSRDALRTAPPPEARSAADAAMRAAYVVQDLQRSLDPRDPRVQRPALLLLLTALALALPRGVRLPALGALILLDLATTVRASTPLTPLAATRVTAPPPADPHAHVGIVDRRVTQRHGPVLAAASLNLLVPAREVFVPTPLRFPRWDALVQAAGLGVWPTGDAAVATFAHGLPLARRLGVAEVRSTHDLSGLPGVRLRERTGEVATWTIEGALPRARVATCAEVLPVEGAGSADARALARLRADIPEGPVLLHVSANPRDMAQGALSPVEAAKAVGCVEGVAPRPVAWEDDGNDHLALRATGPGWLVLADPWAPGWRATVNGVESPVRRVDLALRGVWLPAAGEHAVELRYRTPLLPR